MPLPKVTSKSPPGFCQKIPKSFASTEEARNSLDYHFNQNNRIAHDFEYRDQILRGTEEQKHIIAFAQQCSKFKEVHQQWDRAFEAFIESAASNRDPQFLRGVTVLKMHACVHTFHLAVDAYKISNDQTCWDELLPKFTELVDLVSIIVDDLQGSSSPKKPTFCLDMNIVPPLFVVAHKCRDPIIRRKAIALLYSVPRQEGCWDSILTARVAEEIVAIEEAGLGVIRTCEDVPDEARIFNIKVQFDLQGRNGTVKFMRKRLPGSAARETISVDMEW